MGYLFYVEFNFNFNSYFLDYALSFEKSFSWPTSVCMKWLYFYVSSIAFDPLHCKYFTVKNIASRMSQNNVVLEREI